MARYVVSRLKISIRTALAPSRKDQEYAAEQPVCPDECQKGFPSLPQFLKRHPGHLNPENPPNPLEKAPKQKQDLVLIPLTQKSSFCIFRSPQSEFLSISN
jgi:hypothetical protein